MGSGFARFRWVVVVLILSAPALTAGVASAAASPALGRWSGGGQGGTVHFVVSRVGGTDVFSDLVEQCDNGTPSAGDIPWSRNQKGFDGKFPETAIGANGPRLYGPAAPQPLLSPARRAPDPGWDRGPPGAADRHVRRDSRADRAAGEDRRAGLSESLFPEHGCRKLNAVFDERAQRFMRTAGGVLDRTIASAASQAHVHFVDVRDEFADHELCARHEWVDFFVAPRAKRPSAVTGSFHANAAGSKPTRGSCTGHSSTSSDAPVVRTQGDHP
jgi:hypothetical protein